MKKRNLIGLLALALILVMALSLCACGGGKDEPEETSSEVVTTAPETTAPETTAPETEPAPILPTTEEMTRASKELIEAHNTVEQLASCALEVNTNYRYTSPEGYSYTYVSDSRFQNFGDISIFMSSYFTSKYANDRYPYLYSPGQSDDVPMFLYINDGTVPEGLYMVEAGRGYYYFDPYVDLTFSDVTENSFTVSFDYDQFGAPAPASIYAVKENGLWKIDDIVD